MKRLVVQLTKFSKVLDELIANRKLTEKDFLRFEDLLVSNPEFGDVIQGTGGLRKTRLQSSSKGKSGGFRVCYCDVPEKEKLFLIVIFPKNVKENLSDEEKKFLRKIVESIKKE